MGIVISAEPPFGPAAQSPTSGFIFLTLASVLAGLCPAPETWSGSRIPGRRPDGIRDNRLGRGQGVNTALFKSLHLASAPSTPASPGAARCHCRFQYDFPESFTFTLSVALVVAWSSAALAGCLARLFRGAFIMLRAEHCLRSVQGPVGAVYNGAS